MKLLADETLEREILEEHLASEQRVLDEAHHTQTVRHIGSLLGTFDGYAYARGKHFVLRRRLSDVFWTVFCGTEAWPDGADGATVIAKQLVDIGAGYPETGEAWPNVRSEAPASNPSSTHYPRPIGVRLAEGESPASVFATTKPIPVADLEQIVDEIEADPRRFAERFILLTRRVIRLEETIDGQEVL